MIETQEIEQRSVEWHEARLGKVTASRVKALMVKPRAKSRLYGDDARTYMAELIAETLTGEVVETPVTFAMQWGIDCEPQAKSMYEFLTDQTVKEVGFIRHPEIKGAGASPDGLVDDDGLIEIKCQASKNHLRTIMDNEVPKEYLYQIQWQLACTGRKWCDFVVFDPRLPSPADISIMRVERDEEIIETMVQRVNGFLKIMAERLVEFGGNEIGENSNEN